MTGEPSKSDLSRMRILDAAAQSFRRKGYTGTTLNDIAKTADMQAGSLFYYFASKDELLEEVLDIGIRRVHEAVEASQEQLPEHAAHRDRLRAAVEAHFETLLKHGDYTSANIRIFGQVPEDVRKRHLKLRDAYAALWRRLLTKAQKAGALRDDIDLGLVRMLLLGALNWSVEWYQPGKKSIQTMADHMCLILFDGIGQPEHEHLTD
jgi:TetR/AcrR family transcriptional regulator, cholesterol catabolism regulator